ncbi:MAG: GAF domain-containing protein, partial [Chloroflexi bacterium]|nr:GAF domain-containing protein [Chloroflexota bacterium]
MMPTSFKPLLTRQEIATPEARADLNILRTVVAVAMLGSISTLVSALTFGSTPQVVTLLLLLNALQLACFIWMRRRILFPARIIAPLSLYVTVTFLLLTGSGLHDIAMIAYGGVIVVSGLTLGLRATFVTAFTIVVTVFVIWWLEATKAIVTNASFLVTAEDPFLISIVVLAIGFAQAALITRAKIILKTPHESERIQREMDRNLGEIQHSLEQRILERTSEIEKDKEKAQKRTRQFEAMTGVTRAISRSRVLDEVLPQITDTTSTLFGFYHVAVFLTDPTSQFAILSAANSEGGKQMLQRGHQLRIGSPGIIGHVTRNGSPRIDLDVGVDAIQFEYPDLPKTRSEMTLPLKIEKQVIGALDIHSSEENAFSTEDLEVFSALAEYVSLTIENARFFERTRVALAEAEAISRQNLRTSWGRLPEHQNLLGYKYSIAGITPLQADEATSYNVKGKNSIAVPINLRGEKIGTLTVHIPPGERLNQDQIDLIKAVADRVAFSAENARLFDETQKRAERERLITEITSKIGTSVRTETILKTTAKELNQLLEGAEVP